MPIGRSWFQLVATTCHWALFGPLFMRFGTVVVSVPPLVKKGKIQEFLTHKSKTYNFDPTTMLKTFEPFKPFSVRSISNLSPYCLHLLNKTPILFLVLKGSAWLPIIETICPSNLRTFQPVDDLGGIHLLILLIAMCQNSIQRLVHFAHIKYSGQFRKHPFNVTRLSNFIFALF